MKTRNAIISAAAYCSATCSSTTTAFTPTARSNTRSSLLSQPSTDDVLDDIEYHQFGPLGGGNSESPRSLDPNRTFLGMRRESGSVRRMMEAQRKNQQQKHQVG